LAVVPGAQLIRDKVVVGLRDPQAQTQPAGIDLTVDRIESFMTRPSFMLDSLEAAKTKEMRNRNSAYVLRAGPYRLTFSEEIRIPSNCCGLVLPRSSLLRSGIAVHTALWDPGYEGKGKVLLSVLNRKGAVISIGARVAQLVVLQLSGKPHRIYSGQYQREGMESTQEESAR
jgi:dUTP pyrophosphatase